MGPNFGQNRRCWELTELEEWSLWSRVQISLPALDFFTWRLSKILTCFIWLQFYNYTVCAAFNLPVEQERVVRLIKINCSRVGQNQFPQGVYLSLVDPKSGTSELFGMAIKCKRLDLWFSLQISIRKVLDWFFSISLVFFCYWRWIHILCVLSCGHHFS